jgi:hypothetical protein
MSTEVIYGTESGITVTVEPIGLPGRDGNNGTNGAVGSPPPVVVLNTIAEYPGSPTSGTFYVVKA